MTRKSPLLTWVIDANGRLEPFDEGRIAERLYLASDMLDRPDPLLSRELTASVVPIIAANCMPRRNSESEANGAARQIRPIRNSLASSNVRHITIRL